jgi:hypothetical protein
VFLLINIALYLVLFVLVVIIFGLEVNKSKAVKPLYASLD